MIDLDKIKIIFKNKRWLYITSELVAIYLTYLISRLWILNTKGIVTIGTVLSIIILFLTRMYLKKNAKYTLKKKKEKVVLSIEVLVISLLTILFCRSFFISTYNDQEIEISSVSENTKLDVSVIDSVVVNNLVYLRYGDEFNHEYDDYMKKNNHHVVVEKNDDVLKIKVKKSYSLKINFNYLHEGIKVTENEKSTIIPATGVATTYKVQKNGSFDGYSILRGMCSLITVGYVVYMIITFIINPSNKKNRLLILTAIITFGIGLYYINDCSLVMSPDSYSYVEYDFKSLLSLIPGGRTPIYPMILNGIKLIFEDNFLEFTVIVQYVIWFVSIIYLYKSIEILTKNQKMSALFSVLYAICPFAVIWNGSILTESLALSGTLIFIYYIIKYIKTEKVLYGNISIILSSILTFIRPTAIIYLVGLLIFILMRLIFEKLKKCDIKCLITEIICLMFVVFYAICFHKVFGIYSISDAVVRQDLMVTIREGFYKNSNDEEFIENVELALLNNPDNEWSAMSEVLFKYPLAKTKELTNYCRKESMKEYIQYIIRLTKQYAEIKFEGYAYVNMNPNTLWIHNALHKSFVIITFLHVYILIAIEILLMIIKWIKNKKVPWIYCGLFFFPLVIVVSSFIGTCGEFMRTACCCVPFAYLIFVMLMYDMFIKKEKTK